MIKLSISDKSMALCELKKKLTVASGDAFVFKQINKLTRKICSNLFYINKQYYPKLRIPIMHRQTFPKP